MMRCCQTWIERKAEKKGLVSESYQKQNLNILYEWCWRKEGNRNYVRDHNPCSPPTYTYSLLCKHIPLHRRSTFFLNVALNNNAYNDIVCIASNITKPMHHYSDKTVKCTRAIIAFYSIAIPKRNKSLRSSSKAAHELRTVCTSDSITGKFSIKGNPLSVVIETMSPVYILTKGNNSTY